MPYKVRANHVGEGVHFPVRVGCDIGPQEDRPFPLSTNGPNKKQGPESPKDARSTGLPAQRAGVSLVTQASVRLSR